MSYLMSSNPNKIGSYISPINALTDFYGNTALFSNSLQSLNFNGNVPMSVQKMTASSVKAGYYFISSSATLPTISNTSELIYYIGESVNTNGNSVIDFYKINTSLDLEKITASALNPTDYVWVYAEDWDNKILGDNGWIITPHGNAIFSNISVRGNIEANSGYIGGSDGWNIISGQLFSGSGNYAVGLSTSNISIYAGSETASLAPFYVTNTGNVYAQNANISGSISTSYGDIGGFLIDNYQLKKAISKNLLSLYDPGFETKWANYYTNFANRLSAPATGTVSSSKSTNAIYKKFGFNSAWFSIVTTGDPDFNGGITSNFFLPVNQNTQYVYSIYIQDQSNIINALTASFYNSSSALISSGSQTISTTTSFARYSYVFTTPASTSYIKYGIFGNGGQFGAGGTFSVYFDGIQIELGSTATSWDIDSNIRVVSNAQNNEEPYRLYITENTAASTTLLALNPNGFLQSRYIRINPLGDSSTISMISNDHAFQIGTSSAQQIRMDSFGIQSVISSSYSYLNPATYLYETNYTYAGSSLFINKLGGDVIFGGLAPNTSNLQVYGSGSFTKGITASNAYIVINGTTVNLGGSATISASAGTYVETIKTYVRNGTASTILKGQAVYVTGASGTNILVGLAENDTEEMSSKTLGLMETDVAPSDRAYVITQGLLSGLNTSTAIEGDPIWLSASPGGLIYGLTNKPYAPNHLVYIGVVTRSNATNGEVYVKPQNGFELRELHDVSAQSPNNNDILVYNQSSSLWITSGSAPYASNSASFGGISSTDALLAISGSYSIVNTASVQIDSWTSSAYTTAEYTLQLKQSSSITSSKVLLAHDNSGTVNWTEHSIIDLNGGISKTLSFTRDSGTGKILMSAICSTAASANPVKFSFYRSLIST